MWYDCHLKRVKYKLLQVALRPSIMDACPHPKASCKRLQIARHFQDEYTTSPSLGQWCEKTT